MLKLKNILFDEYVNYIFEGNQKFNLTGFKTKKDIYEHLITDTVNSLLFLSDEFFDVHKIIDVGSGNGVPGIVLAILYPNFFVTLVESNKKKSNFLIEVIKKLKLPNVDVICSRAEHLNSDMYTEKFDLGISRAVGSIAIMNELLCRYIKLNKYILHLKSLNYDNELNEANNCLNALGLKLLSKHIISTSPKFNVNILFQKIKKTDSKFPRN